MVIFVNKVIISGIFRIIIERDVKGKAARDSRKSSPLIDREKIDAKAASEFDI